VTVKKVTHHDGFDIVQTVGCALPGVETVIRYDGASVLKVNGSFMAGIASHESAEPGTLVVRCQIDERERLIEDAPETYYVTDYYRRYPLVLARLVHLGPDALRDLLSVSRRLTLEKSGRLHSRQRQELEDFEGGAR
jgi:hypothetical protein